MTPRTFECRMVVHLCMIIHPSLFRYAISLFAARDSPGNISLHFDTSEVAKSRTVATGGLEDAHSLGNRCASETLVVRGVDGRQ
jgi:hypothetical protein